MKRALISVSDKTGVIEFARGLESLGVEIISTGGTFNALREAGVSVIGISEITGFPECLDGRLKTLHPNIHGGILAVRDNPGHMEQLASLGIQTIDILVVNLYPFKQTVRNPEVGLAEAIEMIDIGGPAMLRAAAKNYLGVTAITDPADYMPVLAELRENGHVSAETNQRLAAKVFMLTADYDSSIAAFLKHRAGIELFPETLTLTYEKVQDLRYGENPHQKAAFYREESSSKDGLADAVQLHGKELSFNNINDTHGALELLREFDEPTVVACKHGNPCGVGCAETIAEAWRKAYNADPVSVFGGIVTANREIDAETAAEISKIFVEIVLAPSFEPEALKILSGKKNIRLLRLEHIGKERALGFDLKKVSGGLLAQENDNALLPDTAPRTVTKRAPSAKEMEDLLFAWKVVKYVKSNGIAIAKNKQSAGVGPGQVNRIWPTKQAIEHGIEQLGADALEGAVLASDAYFPFPDCVEAAAAAGVAAIIQPGGSLNDQASIDACDRHNIAMIFTGMRHFRH
ncbi:MAG: bifunctional phosphoribosylaminoimidazolecarboxamide formyltransferase/IMP cyclohydrolase [Clostridiales bacterium]|jgi:phosphoribosylaminoimidazolecarboxamide formyltransferase/IMP cyclohydrolase|nr:bifunctional phosphoribosylaminoimidazolecarboxamide formyltransferase/IMP cyclohydrolase [Clostridiales bacterium]